MQLPGGMILHQALVCILGLVQVGGLSALASQVPAEKIAVFPTQESLVEYLPLLLIFAFPLLSPPKVHRLLLARDTNQATLCLRISAVFKGVITAMTGIVGLVALALAPRLQPDMAMTFAMDHILPIGLRGLAISGLLSAMMSTCDSLLNTAGVAIVHDVALVLKPRGWLAKHELLLARVGTVSLAAVAVFTVQEGANIIDLMLHNISIWFTTIFVPLAFGLLGIRASKRTFIVSTLSGAIFWVICAKWIFAHSHVHGALSALPAMALNALLFTSLYAWENRRTNLRRA